jgi:hypothetical protein
MPALQALSSFAHPIIGAHPTPTRLADAARKCIARTLSRGIWQSKNFRG